MSTNNESPSSEQKAIKVGFDAKRLFLNHSGLGNYSRWIVSGLVKDFPQNNYHLYTTAISSYSKNFLNEQIQVHLPPGLFKSFWRSKGIKKDLLNDGIEIYHGLSNELPLGIEKTNIKSVVTIHDLIFLAYPEYYNTLDRKIYERKFKSACLRADKIVANSIYTKNIIVENYEISPAKIEVIYLDSPSIYHSTPNPADQIAIKSKFGLNKSFFLNVGSFGGRKNQFRILEAYSKISSQIDQDFIFVGKPNNETGRFLESVAKFNLSEKVRIITDISEIDLFNLYHASYATVFPSLSEGFGIPIIESYRCNKPVLTSFGSALEEIAGTAGLLCDPLDTNNMANQILKLTEAEVYNSLKINIHAELERFEPKKLISDYMTLYHSMLK